MNSTRPNRAAIIKHNLTPTLKLQITDFVPDGPNQKITFRSIRRHIESSQLLLKSMVVTNWEWVPDSLADPAFVLAEKLANALTRAAELVGLNDADNTIPENVASEIIQLHENLFGKVSTISAYIVMLDFQIGNLEVKAQEQLSIVTKAAVEIQRILEQQRLHTVDAVVSTQRQFFENEATTHETYANRWLLGVCISAATALAVATYASLHVPDALSQGSIGLTVFAYLPRFILLSIVFYVLSICGRNYRTNRHNFIVNRHRSLALSTFGVFVSSTKDPKIKDAILIQAASAIYSPQPSGYSIDQNEPLPHAAAVDMLQRLGGR
ncbi:hypothetical protein KH5H1_04730 [Corallococcus caeni]|uniref:hypothetical protein n=1 Tax=Corallococcus caeni TaxID=3082388 RepID=UPI00295701DB|nr:hypothetical protein KH5H1_04730 [Corallococcus sp. KH5-1]